MMTKSRKLRWVVMMASALIVTFAVSSTAVAKPGPLDRAMAWGREKVNELKELKEKGEEAIEKGKELKVVAIQAKDEASKFGTHCEEFWAAKGPRDLVGRSIPHYAFIVVVWSGVMLILYRKEDYPQGIANLALRSAIALVPAVISGFLYEMLRSSNINQLMEVVDSAPDLPIVTELVTGFHKFAYYGQYVLPGLAGLTLVKGLHGQRRWLHKFHDFGIARREQLHWPFLLRDRRLPDYILEREGRAEEGTTESPPQAETPPTPPDAPPAPTPPAPEPTVAPPAPTPPAPEPTVAPPVPPTRPQPTLQHCPSCGAQAEAEEGDRFCDHCGGALNNQEEPAPRPGGTTRNQGAPPSFRNLMWRTS